MNCSILNGVTRFGFDDGETDISPTGSSTIDYFLLSNDLCTVNTLDSLSVDSSCVETAKPLTCDTHNKVSTCRPTGKGEW